MTCISTSVNTYCALSIMDMVLIGLFCWAVIEGAIRLAKWVKK